jgi:hypothetical protein
MTEPGAARLIDERSAVSVRQLLGAHLAGASVADFAIARIRLLALDLGNAELATVRCRVLLGRLEVDTLARGRVPARNRKKNLQVLVGFAQSGRLEVRVSALRDWVPDFSVFQSRTAGAGEYVTVLGAHYFARPLPVNGPAFTCILRDPEAARLARRRFDGLWREAYDVLPVVTNELADLLKDARD